MDNVNLLKKVPANVRYALYVIASLAALAWAAYEAANEDWKAAIPVFIGSVIAATAATHAPAGLNNPPEG